MNKDLQWKERIPFSLMRELKMAAEQPRSHEAGNRLGRGVFQPVALQDAVKQIQSFLSQSKKTDQERSAHNEILHQAVIGNPQAQHKVKAILSQWLVDQRIRLEQCIPGMSETESLFAEAIGLSVIEDLYKSRLYEEIQVVGAKVFGMVKGKKLELPHRKFHSAQHVMDVQQRLVLYGQARISEREPFCQTYMYDGSRLTMKMPPFSSQPTITIRRFIVEDVTLHGLQRLGTMDESVRKVLALLVQGKANGIIAGDTGTGKTTLLNALIDAIPENERIVTLESEFELRVEDRYPRRNVIALQEMNDIGIRMKEAFPTVLRETPDRIIVGEVRSGEVVDALKACSRGHRGSWFTLHLTDPQQLKYVLYTLYLESGLNIPFYAFEIQLGLAMDVLVYMRFLLNGNRVVYSIHSIGLDEKGTLVISPMVELENGQWIFRGNSIPGRLHAIFSPVEAVL